MSDPDYWRAVRNLVGTEATVIIGYTGYLNWTTGRNPHSTEWLIQYSEKMAGPIGPVPAGTFDDAFEAVSQLGDEITTLYRAVSPEEFYSIMESGEFTITTNFLEAKQFGLTLEETLKFADWASDTAAIVEVKYPQIFSNIWATQQLWILPSLEVGQ